MSTQSSHPGNGGPVSTTGALGGAPPHSLEAEQSVLGAILLSERSITQVVIEEGLRPEDFYRRRHGVVFEAMLALYAENEPIDVLTVNDRLRAHSNLDEAGGDSAVDSLTGGVPVAGNARRYARIVKEQALLRGALTATYEIQAKVTERDGAPRDIVEWAERRMLDVAHDDRQKDFKSIEDVLFTELDKLERLSREGTALTGTPSGFKALDDITGGFQPGNLVIIAARPSMGKCIGSRTRVCDPMTGGRRRVDEIVAAHERGEEIWVTSVAPDLTLRPSRVSGVFRNGVQPLLRVTTRLGRWVDATANHPLLTMGGWERIDQLAPGARVAVPRRLPFRDEPATMPDHEVVLLAALIADGSLGCGTPMFTAASGSALLPEVERAAHAIGARFRRLRDTSAVHASFTAPERGQLDPVTQLCRRHGIMGKRSEDKFVPDAIFGLSERQIVRFLGILYGCDGHLYVTDRLRQIGYTTISERLARDVQHLLLRLGIVSRIRTLKRSVYDGTDKVAREVLITGQAGLGAFCSLISVCGKEERGRRVLAGLDAVGAGTNTDTVPAGVWHQVLKVKGERSWSEVSRATGHPPNHNWHVGSRGLSRERLTTLADWSGDEGLHHLATSDLWWDEIASIEPIGEDETYDLTVPGDHNFVADDIVVHNSALVTNIAENVALDHGKAVALFSLEMSEAELAQRFLASQADVPGDHLRKGRVKPGKWSSVVGASRRLAAAPLWVDDSSDVGLLEVRAKARRLHQQHELGLIIIDYLQLLRPDGSQDSRVLQIGEMSRGLKILAGELQVPVIALSQLSRAVESRTDKHPMLSDLRESGCVTGDTPVYLADSGSRASIRDLVGRDDVEVLALDPDTWTLERRRVRKAFCTGTKPVFRLTLASGRTVRATGNHRFLTIEGWRRLDELDTDTHLATPRALPAGGRATMTEDELALLGHLIGDGCVLPRHAVQYTTVERELASHVCHLARRVFGDGVLPRIRNERSWLQVYLPSARPLTHGVRNPVTTWFEALGIFGLRPHEKRVPDRVFEQPAEGIAAFLRHLWATDGSIWAENGGSRVRVYYATSSRRLADDVQSLLLRLGIMSTTSEVGQRGRGRPRWHVQVRNRDAVLGFLRTVGTVGTRRTAVAAEILHRVEPLAAHAGSDVIPRTAWRTLVQPAMASAGTSTRALHAAIDTQYCGSTLYRSNIGRVRARRVAEAVACEPLRRLAASDVSWDRVRSIEPDGVEEVFDLEVDGLHNFVAGDIVAHNSIEQDSDLVMFIYRDEYYDPETERQGEADLIIAKHRSGGLGTVPLVFQKDFPRFRTMLHDPERHG